MPTNASTFDEAWPELANRLRGSLIVRGVPAQDRDDVVQETALRVYRAWDTIDPDRPAWPFVMTVALNFWRDVLRERGIRPIDLRPASSLDVSDSHDVEREVLARQELARVGVAMRAMAPDQRRLLFATEEFADRTRPLLPAERVARMRVRRQLARAVGRASAVVAVLMLRRPIRSAGLVTSAYAGAMAAAVLTVPSPLLAPGHLAPARIEAARPPAAVHALSSSPGTKHRIWGQPTRIVARPVPVAVARAARDRDVVSPRRHPSSRTEVCSPQQPPTTGVVKLDVHVGAMDIYADPDRDKASLIAQTPAVDAHSGKGCVAVG